jgi:transposase InsO family protein
MCRAADPSSVQRTRMVTAPRPCRRAKDLLNRDFRTTAPNRVWVTDLTYVATWSGFADVAR